MVKLTASTGRYDGDLKHFVAVIRGDESAVCTAKHDLAVQETILRASEMPCDT